MSLSIIPVLFLAGMLFLQPPADPGKKTMVGDPKFYDPYAPLPKAEVVNQPVDEDLDYKSIFSYISTRHPKIEKTDAEKISKYLVMYGKEHGVDPKFAAALISRESGFNRKAVSRSGAKGLGQIKDFNFKALKIQDPFDIQQNVYGTTLYLKEMLARWRSTKTEYASYALASYYMGPNAVKKNGPYFDKYARGYIGDILKNYETMKQMKVGFSSGQNVAGSM